MCMGLFCVSARSACSLLLTMADEYHMVGPQSSSERSLSLPVETSAMYDSMKELISKKTN